MKGNLSKFKTWFRRTWKKDRPHISYFKMIFLTSLLYYVVIAPSISYLIVWDEKDFIFALKLSYFVGIIVFPVLIISAFSMKENRYYYLQRKRINRSEILRRYGRSYNG